ncbi:glycosyltransferase family A protein [Steroidobacter flavus]|uniref:Glycosyltransferase family A protein n=1 Tax=Steroidobacter flavus TaxID=1842136 RepID=A0ABV8SN17_9GAMM
MRSANMTAAEVSLQVNLHPLDAPHVAYTLPHQIRALGPQVGQVLLTVDLHRSQGSRYRIEDYDQKLKSLQDTLDRIAAAEPKVKIVEVDYTPPAMRRVARDFLGQDFIPKKAHNGSPFYAYLFGVHAASGDYVIHLDSDMLFGGGSHTWVGEALEKMAQDPSIIACNPLAGPPASDGSLHSQSARRLAAPYPAYSFPSVSTRIFLMDKRPILSGQWRIPLLQPGLSARVQAFINYTPSCLALEDSLSAMMVANGLSRLDFLGRAPGLWTLHPVYRTPAFYRELPRLIERIEAGDVPDQQRGHHDLNDSMFDWSEIRAQLTWRRKFKRRLQYAASGLQERMRDLTR